MKLLAGITKLRGETEFLNDFVMPLNRFVMPLNHLALVAIPMFERKDEYLVLSISPASQQRRGENNQRRRGGGGFGDRDERTKAKVFVAIKFMEPAMTPDLLLLPVTAWIRVGVAPEPQHRHVARAAMKHYRKMVAALDWQGIGAEVKREETNGVGERRHVGGRDRECPKIARDRMVGSIDRADVSEQVADTSGISLDEYVDPRQIARQADGECLCTLLIRETTGKAGGQDWVRARIVVLIECLRVDRHRPYEPT
jgi:hypothetical protein